MPTKIWGVQNMPRPKFIYVLDATHAHENSVYIDRDITRASVIGHRAWKLVRIQSLFMLR